MYVRRLEDENVKLTDALKVYHKALEGSQKQGDLSAILYQSELWIHQIISWVWNNFQQFFPNQDLLRNAHKFGYSSMLGKDDYSPEIVEA